MVEVVGTKIVIFERQGCDAYFEHNNDQNLSREEPPLREIQFCNSMTF